MVETLTLYRPVGLEEARLIVASGCAGFPPRLPEQPFFYPVLNADYARQIARDWNTRDAGSGHVGFVTVFDVEAAHVARHPVRTVGGRQHQELWIPAGELADFNARLVGPVRFTEVWYGPDFEGFDTLPALMEEVSTGEDGRDADLPLQALVRDLPDAVLVNLGWWERVPAQALDLDEPRRTALLHRLRAAWARVNPTWPLPAAA
ncbi:hypothetical protein LZ198_17565 [Myxococcus sp. K15C18031901]|uniref:hypothetical protein n=1 Tax=Myxococcus dinghuensis TaxID=2906761 RepID=UPI0020A78399|nr:hypothetical protein [Myxococcus dinghuensis]MCP3100681.1 hypothetical protein [Myxococcus dinghuensis]